MVVAPFTSLIRMLKALCGEVSWRGGAWRSCPLLVAWGGGEGDVCTACTPHKEWDVSLTKVVQT